MLIKVRITIYIVPSICIDLFDSCESVGVEILSSDDYLASSAFLLFIYLFIYFWARYSVKTQANDLCFQLLKVCCVDELQKRKQV